MINSTEELRKSYKAPNERALKKDIGKIDRHAARFIQTSPFCVISSTDAEYHLDASPRGGEPGFIKVLDEHSLIIPDARGNNRLDSLQNIISTQRIGLLFLIPGLNDTLRVNGSATVSSKEEDLAHFAEAPFPVLSTILVTVDQCFLHCAKAFMRSQLWAAESQIAPDEFPSLGEMLKDQINATGKAETREESERRYASEL